MIRDIADAFSELVVPEPSAPVSTIAVYYPAVGRGGGDIVARELLRIYLAMGLDVVLITETDPHAGELDLPKDIVRRKIQSHSETNADNYQTHASQLAHIFREHDVQAVVFAHWFAPTLGFDIALARAMGLMTFVYVQSSFTMFFLEAALRRSELDAINAYRYADGILCLSEMDATYWSFFSPRVYTTPNPAAFAVPTALAPLAGHEVLWPARLHPDKCPHRAVEVLGHVARQIPDVTLHMVGDASPDVVASLTAQAAELGCEANLRIDAARAPEEMGPLYAHADAFLLTSQREGWPLALEEAMTHGVPAVVYDLPYLTLTQCDAVSSVPQGDAAAAGAALAHVLDDKAHAHSCGQQERRFVEPYLDFDFQALWRDLLSGRAEGRAFHPDREERDRLLSPMMDEQLKAAKARAAVTRAATEREVEAWKRHAAGLEEQVDAYVQLTNDLKSIIRQQEERHDALEKERRELEAHQSLLHRVSRHFPSAR